MAGGYQEEGNHQDPLLTLMTAMATNRIFECGQTRERRVEIWIERLKLGSREHKELGPGGVRRLDIDARSRYEILEDAGEGKASAARDRDQLTKSDRLAAKRFHESASSEVSPIITSYDPILI